MLVRPSQLYGTASFAASCLMKSVVVLGFNLLASLFNHHPEHISLRRPGFFAEVFVTLLVVSFFPSLFTAWVADYQARRGTALAVDARCLQRGVWRWLPVRVKGSIARSMLLATLSAAVLGSAYVLGSTAAAGCWASGSCEMARGMFVWSKALYACVVAGMLTFIALPAALARTPDSLGEALLPVGEAQVAEMHTSAEALVESVVAEASASPLAAAHCAPPPPHGSPAPATQDNVPAVQRLTIFIVSIGTRGDVQPFVGFGQHCIARGHRVLICTSRDFRKFVTDHGVEWVDIGMEKLEQPTSWLDARTIGEMLQFTANFMERGYLTWGRYAYEVRACVHVRVRACVHVRVCMCVCACARACVRGAMLRARSMLTACAMAPAVQACAELKPDVICGASITMSMTLDIAEKLQVRACTRAALPRSLLTAGGASGSLLGAEVRTRHAHQRLPAQRIQ